jgi:hypothetical protein
MVASYSLLSGKICSPSSLNAATLQNPSTPIRATVELYSGGSRAEKSAINARFSALACGRKSSNVRRSFKSGYSRVQLDYPPFVIASATRKTASRRFLQNPIRCCDQAIALLRKTIIGPFSE